MVKFLDQAGLSALWNKIKSSFYTKTELDDIVAHEQAASLSGDLTPSGLATAVSTAEQSLTDAQKNQVRENIGVNDMLLQIYLGADRRADSDINKLKYNNTGSDIVRTTTWGEQVTHEAGKFWLNGIGNITWQEMSSIYNNAKIDVRPGDSVGSWLQTSTASPGFRTNLNTSICHWNSGLQYHYSFMYNNQIQVAHLGNNNPQYIGTFRQFGGSNLKAIIPILEIGQLTNTSSGNNGFYAITCPTQLRWVKFKSLKISCPIFKNSPYAMYECIKYMVDNASNTSAITITVHATTYGYLMGTITPTEQVGGTSAQWQQIVTDASAKSISFATP